MRRPPRDLRPVRVKTKASTPRRNLNLAFASRWEFIWGIAFAVAGAILALGFDHPVLVFPADMPILLEQISINYDLTRDRDYEQDHYFV